MLILIWTPKSQEHEKELRNFDKKRRTPIVVIGKKEATYLPQKTGCGKESWQ